MITNGNQLQAFAMAHPVLTKDSLKMTSHLGETEAKKSPCLGRGFATRITPQSVHRWDSGQQESNAPMSSFDSSTPFMLLARIHVKPGCVEDYLELARATDAAVENSEPGMLHHTFDQDPEDPLAFVWSEVYADDAAFEAHVSNPPVQEYLQKHAELGDGFSVEVYGTVGSECKALMESFGLPLKMFETKLGYSRVA